jgi:uncharacterized membrane protein
MPSNNKVRNERIAIYFDIICSVTCSVISISAIIFFTITERITTFTTAYILGLGFWIGLLLLSLFLFGVGIHTYYADKNYELRAKSRKPRKIKAPIVS